MDSGKEVQTNMMSNEDIYKVESLTGTEVFVADYIFDRDESIILFKSKTENTIGLIPKREMVLHDFCRNFVMKFSELKPKKNSTSPLRRMAWNLANPHFNHNPRINHDNPGGNPCGNVRLNPRPQQGRKADRDDNQARNARPLPVQGERNYVNHVGNAAELNPGPIQRVDPNHRDNPILGAGPDLDNPIAKDAENPKANL